MGLITSAVKLLNLSENEINPGTEETLQKVAGMNYDTLEVDKSDPANIVIVKKASGVVVDTKTIKIL